MLNSVRVGWNDFPTTAIAPDVPRPTLFRRLNVVDVLCFALLIRVSTDDFATVGSGHLRRLFDVLTELLINFFDARWDRAIADCEGDTALVLTADVTVPVVRAGAAAFTSVNAVLRTTLGRHTVVTSRTSRESAA
jgi:hypothetical protein